MNMVEMTIASNVDGCESNFVFEIYFSISTNNSTD